MGWVGGFGGTAELAKDLTCDEALEAADDLPLAFSFGGAALEVAERGLVSAHTHDHDTVEGGVGLAVPAAVEPMPAGLAARGRDWAGAAGLSRISCLGPYDTAEGAIVCHAANSL